MKKKPISGQYKVNLDTGQSLPRTGYGVYVVGSKATESPNLERQASLLAWAEDKVKLEQWEKDAEGKG